MKPTSLFAFTCLVATSCAIAQELGQNKSAGAAGLEFSRPETIANVATGAMLVGRFDCGGDGSVYALVQGNVVGTNADPEPQPGLALLGIRPDGAVRSFPWWSVSEFSRITTPRSIFVGNEHVYALVWGGKAAEQQGHTVRSALALKFDTKGNLEDTVELQGDPSALGVFPSGNMLLVSEDRLNHRVALDLVDKHGVFIRELRLNKDDFIERAAKLPLSSRGPDTYSPGFLIGQSKLVPWSGHLLLVPLVTSGLPIVELGEDGVISSVTVHLPDKVVLESIISSGESTFTVQLGRILDSGNPPIDSQGRHKGVGIKAIERITILSRADGNIVREVDLGSAGVEPACESGGVYRLLSSDSQSKLQIITAKER